jgi:acetamidase/formamidase
MPCPAHTIHARQAHFAWDRAIPPVLAVAPGETVTLEVADASAGQIGPESTAAVFGAYDFDRVNPVTGPVFVEGAEPGDALTLRLESYRPSGWGWTALIPGFGLLADQFPEARLRHWHYDPAGAEPLLFSDIAEISLAPFAGTIGLAPAEPGPHGIIPPRRVGGNMDLKDIVAGSTLTLPVEVPGALLSVGDTHAAQGDGEVCGTAIESPMRVTLTVGLEKGAAPAMPRVARPARPAPAAAGPALVTTGIGPDLHEAARAAVSETIEAVVRRHGLDPADAYMLASVAGDLAIGQIVDAPNWTVAFRMPERIFHA